MADEQPKFRTNEEVGITTNSLYFIIDKEALDIKRTAESQVRDESGVVIGSMPGETIVSVITPKGSQEINVDVVRSELKPGGLRVGEGQICVIIPDRVRGNLSVEAREALEEAASLSTQRVIAEQAAAAATEPVDVAAPAEAPAAVDAAPVVAEPVVAATVQAATASVAGSAPAAVIDSFVSSETANIPGGRAAAPIDGVNVAQVALKAATAGLGLQAPTLNEPLPPVGADAPAEAAAAEESSPRKGLRGRFDRWREYRHARAEEIDAARARGESPEEITNLKRDLRDKHRTESREARKALRAEREVEHDEGLIQKEERIASMHDGIDRIRGRVDNVEDRIRDGVDNVQERLGHAGDRIREGTKRVAGKVKDAATPDLSTLDLPEGPREAGEVAQAMRAKQARNKGSVRIVSDTPIGEPGEIVVSPVEQGPVRNARRALGERIAGGSLQPVCSPEDIEKLGAAIRSNMQANPDLKSLEARSVEGACRMVGERVPELEAAKAAPLEPVAPAVPAAAGIQNPRAIRD